jgi:hypothetical protein
MRTRLLVISTLAVASVFGAASAASATPQGPGGIKQGPGPTTTVAPKGPDKLAPKPTPTTVPPKGPGDLAPKPPQGDDPKPKGPGDLVQPTDDGDVEPGPDTTGNGSGSDNYVPPADNSDNSNNSGADSVVGGVSEDSADDAAADSSTEQDSAGISPFVLIFVAAIVGALLAVAATRVRRNEEDVEQI